MSLATLELSLTDAASNVAKQGATVTITLKSGVQFVGGFRREQATGPTVHMTTPTGGWVTIDKEEIAAIGAEPPQTFGGRSEARY